MQRQHLPRRLSRGPDPVRRPAKASPVAGGVSEVVLAAQRGAGNHAVAAQLQRRLHTSAHTVYDGAHAPPTVPAPSPVVTHLVNAPEDYYLADGTALSDLTVHALEKKKYLLGENHGDGTWATRTQRWSYVEKMLEAAKWFEPPTTQEETTAVAAAGTDAHAAIDPADRQRLPLEDINAYILTRALMAQQWLAEYPQHQADALNGEVDGLTTLNETLVEIDTLMPSYVALCSGWPTPITDVRRYLRFIDVATELADNVHPIVTPLRAVPAVVTAPPPQLNLAGGMALQALPLPPMPPVISSQDVKALRASLSKLASTLVELIDTRPQDTGWRSAWGAVDRRAPGVADPIPNRQALATFASPTGGPAAGGAGAALAAGGLLREPAMARNVRRHPGPLLVKLGNAHVHNVAAAAGPRVVEVPRGQDFDQMTQR